MLADAQPALLLVRAADAPVTTGSMMRPVLSHDAIQQMTGQLSSMNLAKQDGEIKIRLKRALEGRELRNNLKKNRSLTWILIAAMPLWFILGMVFAKCL